MSSSAKHLPGPPKPSFWRRAVAWVRTLDVWRLLLSLCMAFITCYVIHSQRTRSPYSAWQEVKGVPVVIGEDATGDIYLPPQNLTVDLSVSVGIVRQGIPLAPGEFKIVLDSQRLADLLSKASDGGALKIKTVTYDVQPGDVMQKPNGVEIRKIRNAQLKIHCDTYASREVKIQPVIDHSQEEPGWSYHCALKTSGVPAYGPAYLVSGLTAIQTEPVIPKGTQSFDGVVSLQLAGISSEIRFPQKEVPYEVIPREDSNAPIIRAFQRLPILFLAGVDYQLQARLTEEVASSVDLHLRGTAKALNALDRNQIRVICDLTPYAVVGRHNVKLQVVGLPPDVQLVRVFPEDINLELGYRKPTGQDASEPAGEAH